MQSPHTRLHIAWIAGLAACAIVAVPAVSARALSVTPGTAAFEIEFGDGSLLKGSIDFVGMVTGTPAGGVVLAGSVAPSDVTLVFTISSAPDATPDILFATNVFRDPTSATSPVFSAIGTIPGSGPDLTFVSVSGVGGTWSYEPAVAPGTTSDPFFLSFSSIAVGDVFSFEEVILPLGTFTVVPEAGMLGLFGLGVGALVWRMRGRIRA